MACSPWRPSCSRCWPRWAPAERRWPGPPGTVLAVGLVLEGDLQLRPVDDAAILLEVYVLPDHLGDADVADGLAHGPQRLRRGLLPRVAARPDDLGHSVHTHDGLPHGWMVTHRANIFAPLLYQAGSSDPPPD